MDNHPTIDLIKTPRTDCTNPVYNCIEYCFRANDYRTDEAEVATALIVFGADNYPDGIQFAFLGINFETATPGGADSFSWTGTPTQIRDDFIRMLNANYEFGYKFDAVPLGVSVILITAKNAGFQSEWNTIFPVSNPPIFFDTPGADSNFLTNYRLVVEVWTCEDGVRIDPILTRGYEPDKTTLEVCVDLSRLLQPFVRTTLPALDANPFIVLDESIRKDFCIRYGEIYADGTDGCESKARYFEESSSFNVINSAFHKDDEDGIAPYCFAESFFNTDFLTRRPDSAEICPSSFAWLWYSVEQSSLDAGFVHTAFYNFIYTDGTSEQVIGNNALTAGTNIVPSGLAQLQSLYDTTKTVYSYSVQMFFLSPFFQIPISEIQFFQVADSGFCCCSEEFYFLNELGGYDTINFGCVNEINLSHKFTEFCSFEPCEGDILEGGKAEADANSFEIFKVNSRFLDKYGSYEWIREFLKSPVRIWNKNGKRCRIMLLNDENPVYRKDGFIFLELEFVLNFELNKQENQ